MNIVLNGLYFFSKLIVNDCKRDLGLFSSSIVGKGEARKGSVMEEYYNYVD